MIAGVAVASAFFLFRSGDDKDAREVREIESVQTAPAKQSDVQSNKTATLPPQPKSGLSESSATAASSQAKTSVSVVSTPATVKEPVVIEPEKPKISRLEQLSTMASSGDGSAACELGQMYLNGNGVKKSNNTAFAYFKQSAELGNAEGMYMTGLCYRMGRGTSKNLDLAKEWWTKAASKGHAKAMEDVKEFDSLM